MTIAIVEDDQTLRVAQLLRMASEEYRQTVILVTHDAGMADYADRLIHIKDGAVS